MAEKRNFDVETVDTHSPAPIAHAVRGIEFPCSKEELREQAEQNDGGEEVLEMIDRMPDMEYKSMADVFKGVGESNEDESAAGGSEEFEDYEELEEELDDE